MVRAMIMVRDRVKETITLNITQTLTLPIDSKPPNQTIENGRCLEH